MELNGDSAGWPYHKNVFDDKMINYQRILLKIFTTDKTFIVLYSLQNL